jgi:hypothetical protein
MDRLNKATNKYLINDLKAGIGLRISAQIERECDVYLCSNCGDIYICKEGYPKESNLTHQCDSFSKGEYKYVVTKKLSNFDFEDALNKLPFWVDSFCEIEKNDN